MKKSLLILAGLALVASSALGQQVLSRNAVGYTRVDVPSSNLILGAIPFNAFSNTITGIFGSSLVGGNNIGQSDEIQKWNGTSYVRYWKANPLGGAWSSIQRLCLQRTQWSQERLSG
jgi:hypothetical protein